MNYTVLTGKQYVFKQNCLKTNRVTAILLKKNQNCRNIEQDEAQ